VCRNQKQRLGAFGHLFCINSITTQHKADMNLLDVNSINEALHIDGNEFIEVNKNDYIHSKCIPPSCAFLERDLEWRQALSKSCGGANHHQWGKPLSEEHKKRISEKNKNITGFRSGKSKIWEITFENGKVLTICGIANWCKENNYNAGHISKMSKQIRKKHKDIVKVKCIEK
jgi:hypothetical protein